jgi:quercetin dioxygenase-like cupin family protein
MPVTPDVVGKKADAVFYGKSAEAPVLEIAALDGMKLASPLKTKVLIPGPKGSLLEHHLTKGQTIPAHRLAHDFINCMVRGRIRVTLAGQQYEAAARDAWSGAPGVEASLEALEDTVLLEWMSPPHLIAGNRLVTWGAVTPSDSHIFSKWDEVEETIMNRVEGETEFGPPGLDIQHRMKVMIPGPFGSVIWNSHRKGKWALHTHQHNWICYLIKGEMKEKFGGTQEYICRTGDIWAAQGGAEHCTEAMEDNEIFEFKWPAPLYWKGMIHSWEPRG